MLDRLQIGRRIRDCRNMAGLSQEELARDADLSTSYVCRVESGMRNVKLEALASIAVALRVSTDYLIFGRKSCASADTSPFLELLNDLSQDEHMVILNTMRTLKKCLRQCCRD